MFKAVFLKMRMATNIMSLNSDQNSAQTFRPSNVDLRSIIKIFNINSDNNNINNVNINSYERQHSMSMTTMIQRLVPGCHGDQAGDRYWCIAMLISTINKLVFELAVSMHTPAFITLDNTMNQRMSTLR